MFSSDLLKGLTRLYSRFSVSPCVQSSEVSEELMEYLTSKELIYLSLNNEVCVKSAVKLALELVRLGLDVEVISKPLSWKDFEELVNEYLSLNGYHVLRNLRFSRRRYEVDVLGVDHTSGIAIVVDCKHWGPGYSKKGRLNRIAGEHRAKVMRLAEECAPTTSKYRVLSKAKVLIPVIVTLTDVMHGYVGGSFVVPILRFNDFISNAKFYIDTLVSKSDLIINKCHS